MVQKNTPAELSNKDAEHCGILGFVGATIATVTLFQHFYFMSSLWVAYIMVGIYIFSIIAFVLLTAKKAAAPILLIITSILLFATVVYQTLATAFSFLVTSLMLYSLIATIVIYIEEMHKKLTTHHLYLKNESDFWVNR